MTIFEGNRDLLEAFRRGERTALFAVYSAYVNEVAQLVRYGFSMEARGLVVPGVREPDRQSDLLQEVFARCFSERARLGYDGLSPYRPYLLRIAKNLMIDQARRGGRLVGTLDLTEEESSRSELDPVQYAAPEEELQWQTLRRLTQEYCASLPSELQKYVRLRFEEENSQEETARLMGVSRRRVRSFEATVRDGLRRHLQSRGFDDDDVRPASAGAA